MPTKLDELIKQMNSDAKEQIITVGLPGYEYDRIPFTSPHMNYCTFGGLPVGKITEFYGEEHGGKTTTALDIVANYQNMSDARKVVYIDSENSLDPLWAKKIGVDTDSIILMKPQTQYAEQIFDFLLESVQTNEVGLWVLDSIPALLSKQEMEKDAEEKTYGGISQPLSRFSRKIEMAMTRTRCTGIGINQLRDDFNSTWGGTTTPGGRAWRHLCSVRMEFRKGQYIDADGHTLTSNVENPAGNIVNMKMVKNKTCPPTRRTGFYTLNYLEGIDYLKDLVDICIKFDVIDKKGGWYNIVDMETGEIIKDKIQGQAKLYNFIDDNPDVMERMEKLISDKITEQF